MPQVQKPVIIGRLDSPRVSLPRLANDVERTPELLEELIAAVSARMVRVKFGAVKVLRVLSERSPELLYPHFDFFAGLLRSENGILRWNAMLILGSLAAADREKRTDRILDDYLAPISGPHLIDAANAIRGATAIAAAKPYLADRIAGGILKVERATYATPECRNVAIGHALIACGRIFPMVTGKRAIQLFVSRQTGNSRAATRRRAESFLRRWPVSTRPARKRS